MDCALSGYWVTMPFCAELLITSRGTTHKLCNIQIIRRHDRANPCQEYWDILTELRDIKKIYRMHKFVGRLKGMVGRVSQQYHTDSGQCRMEGTASVCDVMQQIPMVYKYPSLVETYTACVWRIPRPQNGPVCYYYKDVAIQTDLSLTVDGHVWVKVALLSVWAVPPTIDEKHEQEILIYSPKEYRIASNVGKGIQTDLSIELPRGVYGNITGHPDSPVAGVVRLENAIIRPCSKDNIQLFVYNSSGEECNIQRGDLLASVLLLQIFVPILDIKRYSRRECITT